MKRVAVTIGMLFLTVLLCLVGVSCGGSGSDESWTKGVDHAAQGKFAEAKREFEKSLEADPFCIRAKVSLRLIKDVADQKVSSKAAIHLFRGMVQAAKEAWDEAIAEYNKATEIDKRFAYAFCFRGHAYRDKAEYDRAISDYNRTIELNPMFAYAYKSRGLAHFDKGQDDQALSDFTKAIELYPKYVGAYISRAMAYDRKGQHDQAISDCDKAIEINPKYAGAYNNRAVAHYLKGKYDKAWEDVHKAQSLGHQVHPGFLKALRKASG